MSVSGMHTATAGEFGPKPSVVYIDTKLIRVSDTVLKQLKDALGESLFYFHAE